MTVQYLPATTDLLKRFQMRSADVAEVALTCPGVDPLAVVHASVYESDAAACAVAGDGEVLSVFGVSNAPDQANVAYIWMLSSEGIHRHGKEALRHGRKVIQWCRRRTPGRLLCNYIHRTNHSARAYITRLGATIVANPAGEFDFFFFQPDPHV